MVCEADEPKDEEGNENEEPKKGHGGCGGVQPTIRKEGLKLFVQYKKPKDEDEVIVLSFTSVWLSHSFQGNEIVATR